MLKLSRLHIDAIRKSELRFRLAKALDDRACLVKPLNVLTPGQMDSLHDACLDALSNEAPVLEEYASSRHGGTSAPSTIVPRSRRLEHVRGANIPERWSAYEYFRQGGEVLRKKARNTPPLAWSRPRTWS